MELVVRRHSVEDRRRVEVHLLPKGETILAQLAEQHRIELLSLQGIFTIPNIRHE
jgi:DNA-binding MarR family transcriptional regulator